MSKKLPGTDAHTRYYTDDGTLVPGVTTITKRIPKPFLVKWANTLGLEGVDYDSYMQVTSEIGTQIHEGVEKLLKGQSEEEVAQTINIRGDLFEYVAHGINKFLEWQTEHEIEIIMTETPLVSNKFRYGGTMDFFGIVDGKKWVLDFKSGAKIYDDYACQLSALWNLLVENGHEVERAGILRLGREEKEGWEIGQFNSKENRRIWFDRFKLLLKDYYLEKELRKPQFWRKCMKK